MVQTLLSCVCGSIYPARTILWDPVDRTPELAATGGNVMHVGHVRTGVDLAIDEVEIGVQVETRGRAHCADVLAHLRGAGYRVTEG